MEPETDCLVPVQLPVELEMIAYWTTSELLFSFSPKRSKVKVILVVTSPSAAGTLMRQSKGMDVLAKVLTNETCAKLPVDGPHLK